MAAGHFDFVAEHATRFHWRARLTEDGTKPWDLTGATPFMQVKRSTCDPENPVLEFSTTGGIVTDPNTLDDGIFELLKTTSEMSAVEPGTYVYDLVLKRSGETQRVLAGEFAITPVVTDAMAAPARAKRPHN